MERSGLVKGLLMGMLLLSVVGRNEGAVQCGTVASNTAGCLSYVRGVGAKPASNSVCCAGIKALDNLAAQGVQNRRDICNCLQSAAKILQPSPQAVASLPALCGATHPFSLSQNCNTLP